MWSIAVQHSFERATSILTEPAKLKSSDLVSRIAGLDGAFYFLRIRST